MSVRTYFGLFLISAFASLVLTPLLRRLCQRFGLISQPGEERHIHQNAVPRLGGVAIFLSVIIALFSLVFVRNLLTQTLRADLKPIEAFLICGFLVLMLGVYDDLRGANATVKFLGLIGITLVFYALGGRIEVCRIAMDRSGIGPHHLW